MWILKPVGLNRGQGIHVVNSVKKCKKLIREYCYGRECAAPSESFSAVKEVPEAVEDQEDLIEGIPVEDYNGIEDPYTA